MNTILTIIQREYLVRVRKKSFIVMTILGPLLVLGFYAIIIWASVNGGTQKKVAVIDESGLFTNKFKDTDETVYTYLKQPLTKAKTDFAKSEKDALVFIPKDVVTNPKTVQIFAEKGVTFDMQANVERAISKEIERIKLTEAGISQQVIEEAKVNVDAQTISLKDGDEKSNNALVTMLLSYFCAILIYITLLVYGTQVMRGVMEEKTSRIIEVIISSVKPFQLMLGKIIGVGLVGLTQFALWILLTVGLTSAATAVFGPSVQQSMTANSQLNNMPNQDEVKRKMEASENPVTKLLDGVNSLNVPLIVGCFLFYFLGGYLLYSALYGAIGAAVDSETDTQQFMLPIMMPIIAAIAFSQMASRDPDSTIAFWTSMIPFTSPIVMMARIPFGVPAWELALSMVLLVLGFIGTTWLAARIYRVGILMYGKKPTYKELSKWLFYKA
jgi:ABC-2 type transport system permease protein